MMRNEREIQRAHDILVSVMTGRIGIPLGDEMLSQIQAVTDVLCWTLRHDHNDTFAEVLAAVERNAEEAGYVLNEREGTG